MSGLRFRLSGHVFVGGAGTEVGQPTWRRGVGDGRANYVLRGGRDPKLIDDGLFVVDGVRLYRFVFQVVEFRLLYLGGYGVPGV